MKSENIVEYIVEYIVKCFFQYPYASQFGVVVLWIVLVSFVVYCTPRWRKQYNKNIPCWERFKSGMAALLFSPSIISLGVMMYIYYGAVFYESFDSDSILSFAYFVSDGQNTKMMNHAGTGIFCILFFIVLLNFFTKTFGGGIITHKSWNYTLIILIVIFVGVMVDSTFAGKLFSTLLGTSDMLNTSGKFKKHETLEFIALIIGGVLAVLGAFTVHSRARAQEDNNELVEQGNKDYRFQHMVSDLGHEKLSVRVATFYRFYYLAYREKEKDKEKRKKKKEKGKGRIIEKDIFEMLCSCLRAISSRAPDLLNDKYEHRLEFQTLFDILFKSKFKSRKNGLIPNNTKANLRKVIFADMDLADSILSNTDFFGADLSNTVLRSANLSHANFHNANLTNTNLDNANLSNATLSGLDLLNADLTGAKFTNANLSNTNLMGADLIGIEFANAILSDSDLSNADLSNAELSNAKLLNAYLSDANLSDANLSNADLSGANLSGANLSNANFSNANLSGANFQEAILNNMNLKNVSNIERTDFRGAIMDDRPISRSDLPMNKGEPITD